MAYLALFNEVFEALNLLLITLFILVLQKFSYLAMAFDTSPEQKVLEKVLPWLAIDDFHHIM
jgi:hypothetical protein